MKSEHLGYYFRCLDFFPVSEKKKKKTPCYISKEMLVLIFYTSDVWKFQITVPNLITKYFFCCIETDF